jgi:L-lactate dehydrogenase complex protein LldG
VLAAAELPQRIRTGADARLATLPWDEGWGVDRCVGPAVKGDAAALAYAVAGIAETGTLMLASGPDNPVTLSFLPELEIVAVDASTIVGSLEDALALVRGRNGRDVCTMPRTVNLVSAASRTGDIGGRLVMGAHGPRQLVVLVVKNEEGAAGAPS